MSRPTHVVLVEDDPLNASMVHKVLERLSIQSG